MDTNERDEQASTLRINIDTPRSSKATQQNTGQTKVASEVRKIRVSALTSCQLPVSITDSRGIITRPDGWLVKQRPASKAGLNPEAEASGVVHNKYA